MKRLIKLILVVSTLAMLLPAYAVEYTKVTYIHNDGFGNPVAASDEQGNLEWRIEYYPYGQEFSNTEVNRKSDIGYAGKPYDDEIGLSYFGARWYDPDTGRFTGIDPAAVNPEDWRTFNRYSYAANNPYKYTDPTGNIFETAVDVVSVGLSVSALVSEPTWGNAGGLAYDILATAIPILPAGAGIAKQAANAANKPFALGIDDHLDGFAKAHNATTWKNFNDVENWQPQVLDKILDPNQKVLFNLDGVDVWKGIDRSASGRGGATDWELLQIRQNPQTWNTIDFVKDGAKVENPFQ